MFRPGLSKPTVKNRAQAMVEFALTALLLLLLLTMIIEVARIFQAYVTLQGAARAGARYAITGQWFDKYSGDPNTAAGITAMSSGWDKTKQGDPYKHIPPCWPRFGPGAQIDSYPVTDDYPYTLGNVAYYEPYRDARTCSIEETVVRGMTGLALNSYGSGGKATGSPARYVCCYPDTSVPNSYSVEILGFSSDATPTSGDLAHMITNDPPDGPEWVVEDFSDVIQYRTAEQTSGLVRGYGGDPGQKVVVLVYYNLGLITPILNRIIPIVPLTGTAIMTNEQFGSFGVQSSAVLPPGLPDLPALIAPVPPDLVVSTLTGPEGYGSTSPGPGDPVTFTVAATNQGELETPELSYLKLYYVRGAALVDPVATDLTGPGAKPGVVEVGTVNIDAFLSQNGTTAPQTIGFAFPDGGTYYLYAVADATYVIDETGSGAVADPSREANNIAGPLTVVVTSDADLVLKKLVSDKAPAPGDNVTFSISVTNLGGAIAKDIKVTDLVPSPLTLQSSNAPGASTYNSGVWTIPTLNKGSTITLSLVAKVPAGTPIGTTVTNTVQGLTMDPTLSDPDQSNDINCTTGCKSATLVVGAVNLSLTKTVSNSNPVEDSDSPKCPTSGPTKCFTYTLTAKNLSSVTPALNARITDTLPTGIVFSSGSSGCTASGQTVTCTLGTLAPSTTVNKTLTVYAAFGTGGQTLENTAVVSSDEVDPDPDNNTSKVSVLVQSIDIEVKKIVTPLYIPTNNNFTWTITVKNLGPNTANNVKITDNIPTGPLTAAPTVTVSTGTWASPTWTIPTLNVGASATMTIVAKAKSSAVDTTITNTATLASADKTDVNSANNSATANLEVTNADAADIALEKTVSPTIAGPATQIVYTFKVTNNGPRDATGVTITDTKLSSNTTDSLATSFFNYVSPVPSTWNKSTGVWNVGSLTVGQTKTFTLTLTLNGNSSTPIFENIAVAASAKFEHAPANNTAKADLNVNWPKLVFFNAGGAGCNSVTWATSGADPLPIVNLHNWIPTQLYAAGSQGIYGSRYTLNTPVTGYTFVDFAGTALDADGQNLMACAATGKNFNYQFDGLATGLYEITLVFADPGTPPGKRRFSVDALAYKVKTGRILKNYDVAYALKDYPTAAGQVHYIVKTFQYRVRSDKKPYLRIHFVNGKRSRSYTNVEAIVNGVGITYVGP